MILTLWQVITGTIAIILFIIGVILGYCLIFAGLVHNKGLRILNLSNVDDSLKKEKAKKLNDFALGNVFENISNQYPLFSQYYIKEDIDGNILFYPREKKEKNRILATIKMYNESGKEIFSTENHLHGSNLFNGKTLLFSILDAIESKLKNNELLFDFSILMIYSNNPIEMKDNEAYDLVLEENGGIVDPITSNLNSFYAFVGTMKTGNATIRFTTEKYGNGKERINEFFKEIRTLISKPRINKMVKNVLKNVAKDMNYSDRFIYQNPTIFWIFVKNSLYETDFKYLKAITTKAFCGEIVETENEYFTDVDIDFGLNDDVGQLMKKIERLLSKYSIEYKIIKNIFASNETKKDSENYKILEEIINKTYSDVYVTSFIVNDSKNNFGYDSLGKEHLSFSPIYYSHNARVNYNKGNEYVSYASIVLAVEFYKRLIDEYNRRQKCSVETVAER